MQGPTRFEKQQLIQCLAEGTIEEWTIFAIDKVETNQDLSQEPETGRRFKKEEIPNETWKMAGKRK